MKAIKWGIRIQYLKTLLDDKVFYKDALDHAGALDRMKGLYHLQRHCTTEEDYDRCGRLQQFRVGDIRYQITCAGG